MWIDGLTNIQAFGFPIFGILLFIIFLCLSKPKKSKYTYTETETTKEYKILFVRRNNFHSFYVEYLDQNNIVSSITVYSVVIGDESKLFLDIRVTIEAETGKEDIKEIESYISLTKEDYYKIIDNPKLNCNV